MPGLRVSDLEIPVFVERAVEKALAKSPADRFQSASTFAEALTSGTVVARVGPRRWRRRNVVGAATAVVLLLAAGGWWLATIAGGPAIDRLAVLPFTNLMNDPEQEYLVRGMHSALITELGQAGVTVIGGVQSMMRYQDTQMTVREIADELGVGAVIEGSVFWMGDSVGIDARLVDGGTEESLWSHSYGGDVRDVLTLYRDLARAIADEIQLALTPQAAARLAGARPVNPKAYEAYLKGQVYWDKLTPADLETALQYFELARKIDPNYALAYVGIGAVWVGRQQIGLAPSHEALPRAKAAVEKALELDSTLAEVHHWSALIRTWGDWDWEGGETAFLRAIAINPNYPDVRAFYADFLMMMKRPEEAMAQIERALELDPFNPMFQTFYGMDLLFVRRYDEAIAQFRNTLRTVPNHVRAHLGLYHAFHQKQMYAEALAETKAFFAAVGDREVVEALERGYAEAGYARAMSLAAETLAARSRTTFVAPHSVSTLYALAGENDQALEWLERGYEERDPNMPYLSVERYLDSLRDDPRFQNLLRRMNLPQ